MEEIQSQRIRHFNMVTDDVKTCNIIVKTCSQNMYICVYLYMHILYVYYIYFIYVHTHKNTFIIVLS